MTHTRSDVIRAAGRLFAERGYHATSMRALGRELGLLGSSLYAHISSKEELLVAVVEEGARLFQEAAAVPEGATAEERLRSLMRGHLEVMLENPHQVRTYLSEARSLDDPHRARIIAARDQYEAVFRAVVRQGAADGSFRPEVDAKTSSIFILSTLNAVDRWYDPNGPLDREALTEAISEFVLRAIRA